MNTAGQTKKYRTAIAGTLILALSFSGATAAPALAQNASHGNIGPLEPDPEILELERLRIEEEEREAAEAAEREARERERANNPVTVRPNLNTDPNDATPGQNSNQDNKDDSSKNGGDDKTGTIVGAVIGVLVLLGVLGAGAFAVMNGMI